MGDTVAHAARAPEDPEPSSTGEHSVDHRHHPHTPSPDTAATDEAVKQNGEDVLSPAHRPGVENRPLDAGLNQITMEGGNAKTPRRGDNRSKKAGDSLTAGNHSSSAEMEADNFDKSVEEDLSFSKDGSSENISSIEIDTSSVGVDLSFSGANTANHADDDTSPETETGPGIGPEQISEGASSNSVSLDTNKNAQDISTGDNNAEAGTEPYNYSETSMTESGFVEGCSGSITESESSNKMQNAAAHPQQGDKAATKERMGPMSVTCGDKSVPSRARRSADFGIPRPATLTKGSTMEEEVEFLRQEVRQQAGNVHRLQTSLYDQQTRANVAMVALRTQLRHKDRAMQQVRGQHEQRMSALLSHLLYLEGQMRQEQRHVLELLHEKDDVIRRQKSAIEDLASKNARLLAALKEVHGYSGGNGISTPGAGGCSESGDSGGAKAVVVGGTPVVLRNKDKGQKVRFGSVKEKLRRHKSSLELHRPASLETLVEGTLRYGSQENLSHPALAVSPGRKISSEGLCSDELKKSRQQERKERCKSLIDYPFRLNDLPEVSSEVERGRDEPSPLSDPLLLDGSSPRTSSSSSTQLLSPGARGSLYSDDDEVLLGSSPQDGAARQYGELAKSSSMPQSLASASSCSSSSSSFSHSNQDATSPGVGAKERPHSLPGVELSLNMEKMTMLPMEKVSMNPSPTSQTPPGASESNPFKSFKNVFRRRNSKQRSKKRPASLGQQTNAEYHEALKEHFKKYDLN